MIAVFTYQADPAGGPEAVAEEVFAIFNGHPRCASDADLARAYCQRGLRSLSFPGNRLCCPRSCCPRRSVVWLSLDAETEGPVKGDSWRERTRRASAGREIGR